MHEQEIKVKEIPDKDIDVAINDPAHHIEMIKEEIKESGDNLPPKELTAEPAEIWEDN